jgi:hypothetical protein
LIDAAACIEPPMRAWVATENARDNLYDKGIGGLTRDIYYEHEHILKPHFKKEFGIDIRETLEKMDPLTQNKIDD